MEICKEMQKLRDYLTENKIEWRDDSERSEYWWMDRTKFKYKGHEFSVINGVGSYGGCHIGTKNQGLLECMVDGHEPEGCLKAEDIIAMIEEA